MFVFIYMIIKEKKEISSMTMSTCATFFAISFSIVLSFLCKKAAPEGGSLGKQLSN